MAVVMGVASLAWGQASSEDLPELSSVLSLFSAHAAAGGSVRLNWNLDRQSPTITMFRIYRGYEDIGQFAVVAEVPARAAADSVAYSFNDTTARAGVSYYYKSAAVGQKSESVFPVVITATPPLSEKTAETEELAPVSILKDSRIALYVRRPGRVKLDIISAPSKALVNDTLRPGIYEFEPPDDAPGKLKLLVQYEQGYKTEVDWPVR